MVFKSQQLELNEDFDVFAPGWLKETLDELRKHNSLLDLVKPERFSTKLRLPSDSDFEDIRLP
jgi:hypothetical protein